ncbi:MAG: HAD-IA family hydrolase [Planctomycetes bacterium]|jgi:putative hydrolase of the HAD superfamily|nr:HAD-IA family hydrolase [Planctomycetota bacterium]
MRPVRPAYTPAVDGEIEIIFFDVGGTLLYPDPDVGEVYARAGRDHGIDAPARALAVAFHRAFREKKRQALPQDRAWWREVVDRTFAPFGRPAEPEPLFSGLYDHFARPGAWRLYPDAEAALPILSSRGPRLGVISNWDDRLPSLLAGHAATRRLDPVIVSGILGAEKPDPAIYRAALSAAGVAPGRALMVGDDFDADVKGARAAGLAAVHLDRSGAAPGAIPALTALLDRLAPR